MHLSGMGALAWLIVGLFPVYSVSQIGWGILLFGGLGLLLVGLAAGLRCWRSKAGKAAALLSLVVFAWVVADAMRHPLDH